MLVGEGDGGGGGGGGESDGGGRMTRLNCRRQGRPMTTYVTVYIGYVAAPRLLHTVLVSQMLAEI